MRYSIEWRNAVCWFGRENSANVAHTRVRRTSFALLLAVAANALGIQACVGQPAQSLRDLGARLQPPETITAAPMRSDKVGGAGGDLSRTMIDMSSHNSSILIDAGLREKFGVELIFHRATVGVGSPDESFSKRIEEANSYNYMLGAYHVIFPTHPGVQQADGFINTLRRQCARSQPILLAVDWENVCLKRSNDKKKKCVKKGSAPASMVDDFEGEIESLTGKEAIIYTGRRTLAANKASITNRMTAAPLWLATYYEKFWRTASEFDNGKAAVVRSLGAGGGHGRSVVSKVGYVIPLSEDVMPWSDWTFWQFGGGSGPDMTKKISLKIGKDSVDMSFFNGDRHSFRDFFQRNAWVCDPS